LTDITQFLKFNHYIFDLDNTLIKETDYLFQAYKKIALDISENINVDSNEIENFLKKNFIENGRKNLFDKMLEHFEIKKFSIIDCLNILRNFNPCEISLFPELTKLLKHLSKNKDIIVLTNGNTIQQKNKVKNINWLNLYDKINFFYANDYQPKPSKKSFTVIEKKINIKNRKSTVMIGDSLSDKYFAKNCNISFVHVSQLKEKMKCVEFSD